MSPCLDLPVALSTTSVTQLMNLGHPCDTQGRITFDRLEVSSDEFSFGDMGPSTFVDTQEPFGLNGNRKRILFRISLCGGMLVRCA